jgi:mRNA interferase RelE/StbE
MNYKITWSNQARRHFSRLDKPGQKRVADAVDQLAENPRPSGLKPVISMPGVLRVRVGDYRILYTVDDGKREVWIEDVRHRSKAYGDH